LDSPDGGTVTANILCIIENATRKDGKLDIGIISVTPSTGDVIYDQFEGIPNHTKPVIALNYFTDSALRTELEVSK